MKKTNLPFILQDSKELKENIRYSINNTSNTKDYSQITTEKFYRILNYFDDNTCQEQLNPSEKDKVISSVSTKSKQSNQFKTLFVDPQKILIDTNIRFKQGKIMKSTTNLPTEVSLFKSKSNKKRNNNISLKKTTLEHIHPKFIPNEFLDF